MKTVVVFGSGRVANPAIRTLLQTGHAVVVATDQPEAAGTMIDGHPHGEVVEIDATNTSHVRDAVRRAEAVVSLLPVSFHVRVAEACVAERRPFVTTSYVSDEMRALHAEAKRADVLLLNEVGADPGIDHMLVSRAIHRLQGGGAHVVGVRSVCGGIPAPESADNPFRYKLSWTPRGVVGAGRRPARFRRDWEIVHVGPYEAFDHAAPLVIDDLGSLEFYPNGDSLRFEDAYRLFEPRTMFRGSLRWPGWCETWSALCRMGWADPAPDASLPGSTFADAARRGAGAFDGASARPAVARALRLPVDHAVVERLAWLGLFEERRVPAGARSRADLLIDRMEEKMRYGPGERDVVVLDHEIEFETADGRPGRFRGSLTEYGEPDGDTGMSRLVGLPAAFTARRIVDGTIHDSGVRIPTRPGIYEPILADLEAAGVTEFVHDPGRG
jgi:saccharopine dehydrogenase-like NADP-dependent oxidoreductase